MLGGCPGQPLSTREKRTLAAGVLGAGTGAIVGSAVGAPGTGAAIGALDAGTGLAVDNALQNQEVQQTQPDRRSYISSARSNSDGKT